MYTDKGYTSRELNPTAAVKYLRTFKIVQVYVAMLDQDVRVVKGEFLQQIAAFDTNMVIRCCTDDGTPNEIRIVSIEDGEDNYPSY